MDSIEDIYTHQVYTPFLLYCQERGYTSMADLRRCNFNQLAKAPGITAALLMRIRTLYMAYCKKHPDLLMGPAPRAQKKSQPEAGLCQRLEDYFREHADSLIRLTDICKALGVKRGDAQKALENAPWCKTVDSATYFYVG